MTSTQRADTRGPRATPWTSRLRGGLRAVLRRDDRPDVGPVLVATLRLPDTFGGVTTALLQHAGMLATHVRGPVSVLVYEPAVDLAVQEPALRERGLLRENVAVRALWEELRASPAIPDWVTGKARALPEAPAHDAVRTVYEGTLGRGIEYVVGAKRLAVCRDHLRADGSLLAREVTRAGGHASLTIVGTGGDAVGLRGLRALRRAWTDHVVTPGGSLVVESKGLLPTLARHPLPGTRRVFVVHGSHLEIGATRADAPLHPDRAIFTDYLDDFDRIVFLTHAQLDDVAERYGARPSFTVVPNARDVEPRTEVRSEAAGVVVGRLVRDKGVDLGIRAVADAAATSGRKVTLDVLGEGRERTRLEKLAADVPPSASVTLRGHVPDPDRWFARSSFSVLASSSEGHPLVLVESMAQGCIPIAFDVRYGPAEIIEHGVSGFLVPHGDVAGLTSAIVTILEMPPTEREAMRQAARRRAEDFSEAAVSREWVALLSAPQS